MAVMEIEEIMRVLPHRYPFLLVDRILECDFEKRIVGIKNLTNGEPFFQGHFPGRPVMPGVLQLEAMAQVGGILLNRILSRDGQVAFFTTIREAKFRKALKPGDQMRMEVELDRMRLGTARVNGKTFVDGERASEASMSFKLLEA